MDTDWVLATVQDALETLENAVNELEADPDSAEEIMQELMPAIYAKLNYAWNTRHEGADALEKHDHNDLIAFPKDLTL